MVEVEFADNWAAVRAAHRWDIPERYNLAWDMCEKWAQSDPDRQMLVRVRNDGIREFRARKLSRLSAKLANVLLAHGVSRGDRVGVLLPQVPETVLTHLACYRIGAIVLPLFTLFGADGLQYRLENSGTRALITDLANLPKIDEIRESLPGLENVWTIDGPGDGSHPLYRAMDAAADACPFVETGPDDPAFICYTSGTTGPPKGALHAHRCLLGHVPATQLVHDFWPQSGDRIWTPSDWAWLGGMGNVMMPALRFGVPLIACRFDRFDPEQAFRLMADQSVTNAFLAPTALKLMQQVENPSRFKLTLRSIGSGGESLGASTLDWGRSALGLTINEFYGQTECNPVIGSNARILPVRPGAMGKPIPGKRVVILRDDASLASPGEAGEIAIRDDDPSMFLQYWKNPGKTAEKFVIASDGRRYLLTGDEGETDADGYFWFASRTDDVITSSGYRIGPSEIEDCLNRHPAVALSACVGVPDPVRTQIVRAFVVLADGRNGDPDLADVLKLHVRERLSPHVAPREITWIDRIPMTATGKIMRRELRS